MKKVIIESPFAGCEYYSQDEAVAYAKRSLMHSISNGEAPIAFHLLYPQILDDNSPVDRRLAISAQLEWQKFSDVIAVYNDYGISSGMKEAIDHYYSKTIHLAKKPEIEFRTIGRNKEIDILDLLGIEGKDNV